MKEICVGTVGCGFIAEIHARALKQVYGISLRLVGVLGVDMQQTRAFADKFQYEKVYDTYEEMLNDPQIDVVDICLPNNLHADYILKAACAKKNIICEKPLLGFFGENLEFETEIDYAKRALNSVKSELSKIESAICENHVKLFYAEDWIYCPPMAKARELIEVSKGTILDIRAEESHSGSHAAYTRNRSKAGGGSMLVLGSHPIAAAIHLKAYEGQIKTGKKIKLKSVLASMAQFNTEAVGDDRDNCYIVNDWVDVENWATAILTFEDGSKATITASFAMLGGVVNTFQINMNNNVIKCNMTSNNTINVYAPSEKVFEGVYLNEKIQTNAGWHNINANEDWMKGYPQEMQNFMDSLANNGAPMSDFELAKDVIITIYAAYLSAKTGKTIDGFIV